MKYGYETLSAGPLASPEAITRLAKHGEALGFEIVNVGDHIVVPNNIESRYPYTESGKPAIEWAHGEGSGSGLFLDQITTLAYVAAHTSKTQLLTSVMVVPYRDPVFTAKALATLDVLSNGRLIVGCGVGWMREEFEALGRPPFEERGAVTNEYIEAFKELWTSPTPSFDGKYCSFRDVVFEPKPVQKPHPPIWIGGESPAALRRAARLADVWYPLGANPRFPLGTAAELKEAISRLRDLTQDKGRDPSSIGIAYSAEMWYDDRKTQYLPNGERRVFTGDPLQIAEDIHAFEALGVEYLMFDYQGKTVEESLERMERFANDVRPLTEAAY